MASAEARPLLGKSAIGLLAVALTLPVTGSLGFKPLPTANADEIPNEAVFGFWEGVPADADEWIAAQGGQVLMRDDVIGWVSARFPDRPSADAAILKAQLRADVKWAQHDGVVNVLLTPNDPLYGSQWGWPAIRSPAAWDVTRGATSVKVAVLDTGVALTHSDLAGHTCGPNVSYVSGEAATNDLFGHGTHVAGTVAAVTNNGVGVAGASDSCVMSGKVLNRNGYGQWTWVAAGIRWAADNGAHIISMSLGGPSNPGALVEDSIRYAYGTKNVLVVAAAGNSGCFGDTVLWPAQFADVMAVSALGSESSIAGFSSCGPKVEISAPGAGVVSTMEPASYLGSRFCGGGSYCYLSGTSMATPHVSGTAGLAKAQFPGMTAVELRCLLDLTSDDLGQRGRDSTFGHGRLDAQELVTQTALLSTLPGGVLHGLYQTYCSTQHPF